MSGKKRECTGKGCTNEVHPAYYRFYDGKTKPIKRVDDGRRFMRAYYCTKCQALKWLKE